MFSLADRQIYDTYIFRMNSIHTLWQNLDQAIKYASKTITDRECFLTEIKRASSEDLKGVHNEYKSLEVCFCIFRFYAIL